MAGAALLRHIAPEDWDDIVALEAGAYARTALSEARAVLQSRAAPAFSFVADTGARVAGYLLALPYPRFRYPDLRRAESSAFRSANLHLHDIVVAADLRGAGVARALLARLAGTAAARGFDRISLIAVGGSVPFWSARGFGAHPEVTLVGGYGVDAVYMSRAVGSGPVRDPTAARVGHRHDR